MRVHNGMHAEETPQYPYVSVLTTSTAFLVSCYRESQLVAPQSHIQFPCWTMVRFEMAQGPPGKADWKDQSQHCVTTQAEITNSALRASFTPALPHSAARTLGIFQSQLLEVLQSCSLSLWRNVPRSLVPLGHMRILVFGSNFGHTCARVFSWFLQKIFSSSNLVIVQQDKQG